MLKKILFCFALTVSCHGIALADCEYNGETYPEGTVIGPYLCSDGTWIDN